MFMIKDESQEEGQELSDHDRDPTLEEEQQEEGGWAKEPEIVVLT